MHQTTFSQNETQIDVMVELHQITNVVFIETVPPPPPQNVFLRAEDENILVSWLPPQPEANVLVRGYVIEVLRNKERWEVMQVGYKESSVIVYEVGE